ncbi:MAG: hypothetical protein ACI9XO_001045 [Paraglaciecola sp.]|jgi:hypothetical protein
MQNARFFDSSNQGFYAGLINNIYDYWYQQYKIMIPDDFGITNLFKKDNFFFRKEEVLAVQNEWGAGVVKIGTLKDDRVSCEAFTNAFLDKLYAFEAGPVLFKPTKCAVEQFRPTKAEAASYFIARDDRACEEDQGFAIAPWTKVRFENFDFILEENRAIAMGNYYFTAENGNEEKVEFTFGYQLIGGELKINLHHSSFPYNPNPSA